MTEVVEQKHVSGGEYTRQEAESYHEAKAASFRDRVELHNTLQLIGDLTGQTVADIACGSGWLTRHLKQKLNAERAVGFDLSPDFVSLAKATTPQDLGIEYYAEDARNASTQEEFDVVAANWLLVNARNRTELRQMCQGLAGKCKAGGKLVTIVFEPEIWFPADLSHTMKYGLELIQPPVVEEGATIVIRLYNPSGEFAVEIENYYFPREVYREELEQAGFTDIKFVDTKDMTLAPLESGEDDSVFWKDWFNTPLLMAITATKPKNE